MKRGLMSLLNQDQDSLPDELVIVDDGSVDDTAKVADEILAYAKNRGVSGQYIYLNVPEARISCIPRNEGWKRATGDLIIFTESETLHIGNTIKQIKQKVEEHPNHVPMATQVWSMGRRIYETLDEDTFAHPDRLPYHEYAMLVSGNMQNTKAPDADWGITGSNDCYVGMLFGVWKKDLEAVGGFDESFEGHGWDDWDLFHRLELYGRGTLKCNDIGVIHQWHEKNYPYNIYDAAERNGKISEERIKRGEYKVN